MEKEILYIAYVAFILLLSVLGLYLYQRNKTLNKTNHKYQEFIDAHTQALYGLMDTRRAYEKVHIGNSNHHLYLDRINDLIEREITLIEFYTGYPEMSKITLPHPAFINQMTKERQEKERLAKTFREKKNQQ